MRVQIYKAQPISDIDIPDGHLSAMQTFPANLSVEDAGALHTVQAKAVVAFLFQHLPGGTVDRVLAELLRRKASTLSVLLQEKP